MWLRYVANGLTAPLKSHKSGSAKPEGARSCSVHAKSCRDDGDGSPVLCTAAKSLTGLRCSHNEDCYLVDVEKGLLIVADGIGGHLGGGIASRLAVDLLPRILQSNNQRRADAETVENDIRRAFEACNKEIVAAARRNPRYQCMGTTAVLVSVVGWRLYVAWLGDSRAYLIRQGEIEPLTRDHTITGMLVKLGEISSSEAETNPWRHFV
jgi:protein phosphatase